MSKKQKPSIKEIEALLTEDEECPIEILPNGEVRRVGGVEKKSKPLTFRENLGGEYAVL